MRRFSGFIEVFQVVHYDIEQHFSFQQNGELTFSQELLMKEIKAIIRPCKLTDVITELHQIDGLPGITVSEIKRFGKSSAKDIEKDHGNGLIEYVAKVKIEIVVNDNMVDKVVSVIQKTAHTGNTGDGKIFIIPVEDTIVIRTNEKGQAAI
jgi:nitrogen regulatory protein P-II 1